MKYNSIVKGVIRLKDKEDIIKKLIEIGADKKSYKKELKEVYKNEYLTLMYEINCIQKYNFKFLLLPLVFDLLLIFKFSFTDMRFWALIIIAIILVAIIVTDELINKLKIKSLKSIIEVMEIS